MALKLMYITNRPDVAQIAESAGVNRIFVDLEYIGKEHRQAGLNSVKSAHSIEDVRNIRASLETAELLVRVNPIHDESEEYASSRDEINAVIRAGADIIMLPYFKTLEEAKQFIRLVDGRAKTMLLVETPEAVNILDDLLKLKGVDEVFFGLNDLSLGYGRKFMFELLADGTVERLCLKSRQAGIPFGFGGIASLGKGMLPSEYIIKEHYKYGSTCVILSRSFCNVNRDNHIGRISATFVNGVQRIRTFEEECQRYADFFNKDEQTMKQIVQKIVDSIGIGNIGN